MGNVLLTARGPIGPLHAYVVPETRVSDPQVSDHRLSAFLRPFSDENVALAALAAAGGGEVRREVRR